MVRRTRVQEVPVLSVDEETGEVLSPHHYGTVRMVTTSTNPCYVPPAASTSKPSTRGWCGSGVVAEACCISGRWYRCKDFADNHPGIAWALYKGEVFASKMVAPHLLDEEVSAQGDFFDGTGWDE